MKSTYSFFILLAAVFFGVVHVSAAEDIDFSAYLYKVSLEKNLTSIPKIVEVEGGAQDFFVIVDKATKKEAQTEIKAQENILLPKSVDACTNNTCKKAPTLLDGDFDTSYDFSLEREGLNQGSVRVVYEKPIKTRAVYFAPSRDSYMPDSFSLYADGKLILQNVKSGEVYFPEITGTSFEITFSYTKPIRFGEVGVGYTKDRTHTIRFVYEPGKEYELYEGGTREGIEQKKSFYGNLYDSSKKIELIRKSLVSKNPLYKENDSDSDGVSDSVDNCKTIKNAGQEDADKNGVGDQCDDYDFDGVFGYRDNCPQIANNDQRDTDRDGLGDVCDTEESRPTEKYKLLEWVALAGGLFLLGGLFYSISKMPQASKENK